MRQLLTPFGDGKHLYAVGAPDDALVVFAVAATGKLTFVETLLDNAGNVDGLDSARGVAVSGDGKHVYVAALIDSSIAFYARDAASGKLTFKGILRDFDVGVDTRADFVSRG